MPDFFPVAGGPTRATPIRRGPYQRELARRRSQLLLAGQLRYAGEQPLHVATIVVVHQACPDRAASLPDAEHPEIGRAHV